MTHPTKTDETGFLSRWAKRKQAVLEGEDVPELPPALEEKEKKADGEEPSEERLKELEENRLAAEAIDIESLDYTSDFSAFFKDGVPKLLKQKAMRILWRSNPILANVDGLCDYDENFGDKSLILEKFDSAYRIGKGYLFEEKEEEQEDDEELLTQDETVEEEIETSEDTEINKDGVEEDVILATTLEEPETDEDDIIERPRVSLRKRLQFDEG